VPEIVEKPKLKFETNEREFETTVESTMDEISISYGGDEVEMSFETEAMSATKRQSADRRREETQMEPSYEPKQTKIKTSNEKPSRREVLLAKENRK